MAGRQLEELDWLDLRAVARWSPITSALHRALNPEAWVTPEVSLLRDVEFGLRVLAWQNTADGHKGRRHPKPLLLTKAERTAEKIRKGEADARPMDEVLSWLGWERPSQN